MNIGIDEVGRGAWAGPLLVVAATGMPPKEVTDSKLLNAKNREALMQALASTCKFGEGWVAPREIDDLGLANAMRLGVKRALLALKASKEALIIMDGPVNYCEKKFINVRTVVKADSLIPIVSAASIYAKVKRDRYMATLNDSYGFKNHVGYGTAAHAEALRLFGVSKHHRKSFKPVKALL